MSLEYLQNLNIVYRDLKPENLLFDSTGYLKITGPEGAVSHAPSCLPAGLTGVSSPQTLALPSTLTGARGRCVARPSTLPRKSF